MSIFKLFPAQAGVILRIEQQAAGKTAVPRASGGDPICRKEAAKDKNCSPRKRG